MFLPLLRVFDHALYYMTQYSQIKVNTGLIVMKHSILRTCIISIIMSVHTTTSNTLRTPEVLRLSSRN